MNLIYVLIWGTCYLSMCYFWLCVFGEMWMLVTKRAREKEREQKCLPSFLVNNWHLFDINFICMYFMLYQGWQNAIFPKLIDRRKEVENKQSFELHPFLMVQFMCHSLNRVIEQYLMFAHIKRVKWRRVYSINNECIVEYLQRYINTHTHQVENVFIYLLNVQNMYRHRRMQDDDEKVSWTY